MLEKVTSCSVLKEKNDLSAVYPVGNDKCGHREIARRNPI